MKAVSPSVVQQIDSGQTPALFLYIILAPLYFLAYSCLSCTAKDILKMKLFVLPVNFAIFRLFGT